MVSDVVDSEVGLWNKMQYSSTGRKWRRHTHRDSWEIEQPNNNTKTQPKQQYNNNNNPTLQQQQHNKNHKPQTQSEQQQNNVNNSTTIKVKPP